MPIDQATQLLPPQRVRRHSLNRGVNLQHPMNQVMTVATQNAKIGRLAVPEVAVAHVMNIIVMIH